MSILKPVRVVLHCSATPDYPEHSASFDKFGLDEIRNWHITRGFYGVGYHRIIRRTGIVENGRDIKASGAHCLGHNNDSIGVCYVGLKRPTLMQIASILRLVDEFKVRFGITPDKWYGHREFNKNKTCPGFDMDIMRQILSFAG